jgi:RNA polymerase sigma factor (sigma-70 family)
MSRVPETEPPTDRPDPGRDLRSEISRGQALDRDLARDLGRREPARGDVGGGYIDRLARGPLLPEATERRLVEAARRGDPRARAELVEAYMPLISAAARTYRTGQIQRMELLQEGVVGVLRALERFDPERGVPFWGYATWWVRQAMQQLVAELTRPVVLSDRALRNLARLKQAHRDAVQHSGREPGRDELAERSGLSLEQVDDLLATEGAPRSLHERATTPESGIGTFGELVADPLAEDEYERVLDAIEVRELHALLAGLTDRERDVLRARYGLDDDGGGGGDGEELSLRSVGDRLGLSGERVRQIERRALSKLEAATRSPSATPAA